MTDEETLTIFRKFPDGEIIAIFPEMREGNYMCGSYLHVGQHGAGHYHIMIHRTEKASPQEYADLKEELESIGYNLKIRQKWMRRSR